MADPLNVLFQAILVVALVLIIYQLAAFVMRAAYRMYRAPRAPPAPPAQPTYAAAAPGRGMP